jgi:hypothetical protein
MFHSYDATRWATHFHEEELPMASDISGCSTKHEGYGVMNLPHTNFKRIVTPGLILVNLRKVSPVHYCMRHEERRENIKSSVF